MQKKIPGFLWHGIHLSEMIVTIFGTAMEQIELKAKENHEQFYMAFKSRSEVIVKVEYS